MMAVYKEGSAINLVIRNNGGSVEHYYHFLLGFLFPLALKYTNLRALGFYGPIYIRSCGPMDRLLAEIGFPGVEIIEKNEHISNCAKNTINGSILRQESALGMDHYYGDYPINTISEATAIIRSRLSSKLEEFAVNFSRDLALKEDKRILLINRSKDAFYSSQNAEIPTSGIQRRSIKNFSEVQLRLENAFGMVTCKVLENTTLAEQIALFESSNVIIAQHGAALANIVWCRPKTSIIEIAPAGYRTTCFPPLSQRMGLEHQIVNQDGEHGDCDIDELIYKVSETKT